MSKVSGHFQPVFHLTVLTLPPLHDLAAFSFLPARHWWSLSSIDFVLLALSLPLVMCGEKPIFDTRAAAFFQ